MYYIDIIDIIDALLAHPLYLKDTLTGHKASALLAHPLYLMDTLIRHRRALLAQ
jgi:hypothetical protein